MADGKDKCPDTSTGCVVGLGRTARRTRTRDGICDGLDRCAHTSKGMPGRLARLPDRTPIGDGVCDGIDQCPGTPSGVRSTRRAARHPPPPPRRVFIPEAKKELVLERVYFETDSATLKPESAVTLDKVAASLKDFPDVKIQVAGHTDNTGIARAQPEALGGAGDVGDELSDLARCPAVDAEREGVRRVGAGRRQQDEGRQSAEPARRAATAETEPRRT